MPCALSLLSRQCPLCARLSTAFSAALPAVILCASGTSTFQLLRSSGTADTAERASPARTSDQRSRPSRTTRRTQRPKGRAICSRAAVRPHATWPARQRSSGVAAGPHARRRLRGVGRTQQRHDVHLRRLSASSVRENARASRSIMLNGQWTMRRDYGAVFVTPRLVGRKTATTPMQNREYSPARAAITLHTHTPISLLVLHNMCMLHVYMSHMTCACTCACACIKGVK